MPDTFKTDYNPRKPKKKKKKLSRGRKAFGRIVLLIIIVWVIIGLFFLAKALFFNEKKAVDFNKGEIPEVDFTFAVENSDKSSYESSSEDETMKETEESSTEESIDENSDEYKEMTKLAKRVIDESTSDSDSDLYRIYNTYWYIKNRIKYTGSSNKDNWVKEAVRGFKEYRGDCFTHFAMFKALLRTMGFETIDVTRIGGETRHYWSLVKYEGGWYHIDSCPRDIYRDKYWYCFLRTDEELIEWDKKQDDAKGYYKFDSSLVPASATKKLNLGRMQSRK